VTADTPPERLSALRQRLTNGSTLRALALHVVTFVAIGYVALANLDVADYSSDEYTYSSCGYKLVTSTDFCNAGHPPLTKLWYGVWEYVLGDRIDVARMAASVVAIATAVAMYLILRRCFNWRWGLVGAALWGLTPQVGSDGGPAGLVVRISRYAFLEPLLCFFLVLALYAGYQWSRGERTRWAALTGFCAVAAAMSKEIGIVVAPILVAIPALTCWWGQRSRILRDAGAAGGGGLVALVGTFLAFGPAGGYTNFLAFARAVTNSNGVSGLTIYDGRLYTSAPWWLTLRYGELGMGPWLTAVVVIGVALALASPKTRFLALYCLAATVTIILTFIVSDRALNFYWVAWEPPLLIAATAGIAASVPRLRLRWVAAVCLATVMVLSLMTVVDVGTLRVGPYQAVAQHVHCVNRCRILGVTVLFEPNLYGMPALYAQPGSGDILVQGAGSNEVIPTGALPAGDLLPRYVFLDTGTVAYYRLLGVWPQLLKRLAQLHYQRTIVRGSLSVYVRRNK
jgi:hypothetical protein